MVGLISSYRCAFARGIQSMFHHWKVPRPNSGSKTKHATIISPSALSLLIWRIFLPLYISVLICVSWKSCTQNKLRIFSISWPMYFDCDSVNGGAFWIISWQCAVQCQCENNKHIYVLSTCSTRGDISLSFIPLWHLWFCMSLIRWRMNSKIIEKF